MASQTLRNDTYITKLNQWGLLLSVCTYGAHIALFSHCVTSLAKQGSKGWKLTAYSVILFSLCTTAIGLQIWWTQVAFIDNHDYPGGANEYLRDHVGSLPNMMLSGVYMFINWFVDGLLLYRFNVLWGMLPPGRPRRYILFITVGSFISIVVLGCAFFPQIAGLGLNIWTNMETAPAIAYLALSFAFNAILTVLLMWRILIARCYLRKSFGGDHGQLYSSLAWLIVQSASPYVIVALVAIIVTGLNSPLQYALLPMLGQLQAIPTLVIMRWVVDGRLSHQTGSSPQQSRLHFKTGDTEKGESNGAGIYDYDRPKSPYSTIPPLSLEIPSDSYKCYEDLGDSPADSISTISYPEKAILSPTSPHALIAPEPPSRHSSMHSAVFHSYILSM